MKPIEPDQTPFIDRWRGVPHDSEMDPIIERVVAGTDLPEKDARRAMTHIMSGDLSNDQTGAFLTALAVKGETAAEIAAFARVMREKAERVRPNVSSPMLDTCGTGGDRSSTFNISTTSMFVAAAAGIPVAKHGNRGITSGCGSADVLEALGATIELAPAQVEQCIEEVGVGFMFAPLYHRSMKHVMPVRKELAKLGQRTVFNILGPLSNPANATRQLLGVFAAELAGLMADVLCRLGVERALVVRGECGGEKFLDEISTCGETLAVELNSGEIVERRFLPEALGFERASIESLRCESPSESAAILRNVLRGEDKGPKGDVVLLNTGAAIYVGRDDVEDIKSGIDIAREMLESGKAIEKLEAFIALTNKLAT